MFTISNIVKAVKPSFFNISKRVISTSSVNKNLTTQHNVIIPEQIPVGERNTKDVMKIVRDDIVKRYGSEDGRDKLFKKDGPGRAVAGDLMLVEFYRNAKKNVTTTFAGICIAIHRSGPTTSVTLRNNVLKVGVEQKFRVFSPMIKSIKILRPAEGFRRAKLYYLRDQPKKARLGLLKKLV